MHWRIIVLGLVCAGWVAGEDARAIVDRSIGAMDRTTRVAEDYVYRELSVSREGAKTETKLYEVLTLGGKRYKRLLQKDGKALSAEEEQKEQKRLDKAAAEAKALTAEDRAKRERDREKQRQEERERLKAIPEAFDFRMAGERELSGRPVWEIQATPTGKYRGKYRNLLRNMRGTLYIDQRDYQWARVEGEVLETISFGLFLARLAKGSRISFELTKVNEEVWLPKRVTVTASVRLGGVKKVTADVESTYSNYRKFRTESRVTSVEEVDPQR